MSDDDTDSTDRPEQTEWEQRQAVCPRCGQPLVDLNRSPAEASTDDANEFIDSVDPNTMRDGRHLRAVSRARDGLIRADQTLIAAIRTARAAGDSWQMIATAMRVTTSFARDSYERRIDRPPEP